MAMQEAEELMAVAPAAEGQNEVRFLALGNPTFEGIIDVWCLMTIACVSVSPGISSGCVMADGRR
jgi:precorrin-6B methylase 1